MIRFGKQSVNVGSGTRENESIKLIFPWSWQPLIQEIWPRNPRSVTPWLHRILRSVRYALSDSDSMRRRKTEKKIVHNGCDTPYVSNFTYYDSGSYRTVKARRKNEQNRNIYFIILNATIVLRCYVSRAKRTIQTCNQNAKECNKIFRFIFRHVGLKAAHNASNEFHANVLSRNSISRMKSNVSLSDICR